MHILIIEDDCIFAEILETYIKGKQCSCEVAATLSSAKHKLASSRFDFVLLDNHLPDGNGIDIIRDIKTRSSTSLPVIIITGDDDQSMMAKAFDDGIDDFLLKPLSLDLLWSKIRRAKQWYERESTLEKQAKSLKQLIDNQEREEQLARYVYEHVSSTMHVETECVDTHLQSSSAFNGDFFICDTAPNGNRFVILADATGHGLSAAISILPLVTTIKAMIRKGLSLPHIVHEANTKLGKELPDDKFVTLIGVEINFHKQSIAIFNGGMPDIVGVCHNHTLERIKSTSLALGIMEPEDFDPGIRNIDAKPYKNLFFFSDGLIEQQNKNGDVYTMDRAIEVLGDFTVNDSLLARVIEDFTSFNEGNELQDDLSVCDLQISDLLDKHLNENANNKPKQSGKILSTLSIEGGMIADADIIGIFDGLMKCVDVVGDLRQKAFTVFAELISNALDHGILGLDSALKNDFAGFAEYMSLKEERLANMKDDDKLEMSFAYRPIDKEMSFSIKDTGSGYNYTASSEMQDSALSGRGMTLINKLCKEVSVLAPGNSTSVTLAIDK